MSDPKLEELQEHFERAKKTGHEAWLELEVQLYIAEKLNNIETLLRSDPAEDV